MTTAEIFLTSKGEWNMTEILLKSNKVVNFPPLYKGFINSKEGYFVDNKFLFKIDLSNIDDYEFKYGTEIKINNEQIFEGDILTDLETNTHYIVILDSVVKDKESLFLTLKERKVYLKDKYGDLYDLENDIDLTTFSIEGNLLTFSQDSLQDLFKQEFEAENIVTI